MASCKNHTYVRAPISDQDGGASAPSRVRIRRAMSQGKLWVEFLDMQHKKRAAVDLGETVHLVINTKLGGLVHRLQKSSQHLPRDKRRSHCGWRLGNAVANVRFTKATRWAMCKPALLCSRCFCTTVTTEPVTSMDHSDRIED